MAPGQCLAPQVMLWPLQALELSWQEQVPSCLAGQNADLAVAGLVSAAHYGHRSEITQRRMAELAAPKSAAQPSWTPSQRSTGTTCARVPRTASPCASTALLECCSARRLPGPRSAFVTSTVQLRDRCARTSRRLSSFCDNEECFSRCCRKQGPATRRPPSPPLSSRGHGAAGGVLCYCDRPHERRAIVRRARGGGRPTCEPFVFAVAPTVAPGRRGRVLVFKETTRWWVVSSRCAEAVDRDRRGRPCRATAKVAAGRR